LTLKNIQLIVIDVFTVKSVNILLKIIRGTMKKVLSTALILGALYGTANAAPATSPIFLPEAGKILSTLNIGYTTAKFDKKPNGESDKLEESWNVEAEGKFGITDRLSLNYGFDFDFARKVWDEDQSAKFTDFYVGVTGRVVDVDDNRFDIILNVGQEEAPIYTKDQVYVDLALRYGLDLEKYNLGFSISGKYINDWEDGKGAMKEKLERGFEFGVKLENEFIFSESFTVGLDLFFKMHDDIKFKGLDVEYDEGLAEFQTNGVETSKWDSYNEYGFNIDANFALANDNYIGAYFTMSFSDLEEKSYEDVDGKRFKDPTEYRFGLKYTSQF